MSMTQIQISQALRLVQQTHETLTGKKMADKVVDVWQLVLEPLDYELVAKALMDWLNRESYPPKPVDIVNIVRSLEATSGRNMEIKNPNYYGEPANFESPFMKQLTRLMEFSETHSNEESLEYAKELGIYGHIVHGKRSDPDFDVYFDRKTGNAYFDLPKADDEPFIDEDFPL